MVKQMPLKIVLSASRRTDIPAFYMDWFMRRIQQGSFEVINPYNRRLRIVPADPQAVHTIVFWSKDFGPFLSGGYGEFLQKKGYRLFFNFTINSENPELEPNVPALPDRLEQLAEISRRFDPRAINWRFDPLCFFTSGGGRIRNNLKDFETIARQAGRCGVSRCVTSFMDDYPKIQKRIAAKTGFSFFHPALDAQRQIVLGMKQKLAGRNIALFLCCEQRLLEGLPPDSGISKSACIPNRHLTEIFGGRLSFRKDGGQRMKAGCGCMLSADIGSYDRHPCFHNCLFCYANPKNDPDAFRRRKTQNAPGRFSQQRSGRQARKDHHQ